MGQETNSNEGPHLEDGRNGNNPEEEFGPFAHTFS
jgi:hypothetical protein